MTLANMWANGVLALIAACEACGHKPMSTSTRSLGPSLCRMPAGACAAAGAARRAASVAARPGIRPATPSGGPDEARPASSSHLCARRIALKG